MKPVPIVAREGVTLPSDAPALVVQAKVTVATDGNAVVDIGAAVVIPPVIVVVILAFGRRAVAAREDAPAVSNGDGDALRAREEAAFPADIEG
ncbi:MAG: hypothetical protein J0I97_15045, partial [Microbacterium sp.]|nr:hypothetical protein [Microbacterium sp.]